MVESLSRLYESKIKNSKLCPNLNTKTRVELRKVVHIFQKKKVYVWGMTRDARIKAFENLSNVFYFSSKIFENDILNEQLKEYNIFWELSNWLLSTRKKLW